MLDSKAIAAVLRQSDTSFVLCIRGDLEENLGIYSFYRCAKTFRTEAEARHYYESRYPQGVLVGFNDITRVGIP